MGLKSENTMNGASVLVIDQACETDQLLVSLSKNGAQWLSPVGWTDQQKVTLLECRANDDTTEIDIPAEFASDIKSGDVLVLRCSELDLEKEIIWEASAVETRKTEEAAPVATGLASGLLSRFKGSKTEAIEETKSEAELRAEEADRAAQTYKAKMEAATAAKEEAQRKALEAAREAEAALKMEADRIAEMERAAKAFEEAERLKQDELRRVEEERRAEEARLAEEARRLEDARKREIAAKKEAERKAALERYEAALDITRNEEIRLKSRLKDLKGQAKASAANIAVQAEDLQSRKGLLVDTENTVAKRFNSYETSASKLDVMNADLSMLQSESETLTADRQALSIRLSQADTDYQQAQKEAEAAIAKAEARRAELDLIRQDESEVSGRILSVSEKLSSQSQVVAEASGKTQKLQSKLEAVQAELAQAKLEIEALEQAQTQQSEKDQNLRLEIEATQQAIEDSQAREVAHCNAIEHLEAGGAPEDIADIEFEARSFEPSALSAEMTEDMPSNAAAESVGFKDRMMGRVRRSFAREKDAEISIDVEDVILDADTPEANPVLLAGLEDSPNFVRRHGSSLMALGAVIGGIAIMGGGYALNKSAKPTLEVKSSTPAPTQVASAVTKVELPKTFELTEVEAAKEVVKPKVEEAVEAAPITLDLPKIEPVKVEPKPVKAKEVQTKAIETKTIETKAIETKAADTKDVVPAEVKAESSADVEVPKSEAKAIIEGALTPAEAQETALVVKLAEVVDPTGFAFELPDMSVSLQSKKREVKPAVKKAKVEKPTAKKPAPKKVDTKKPEATKVETPKVEKAEVVKTAAVTKVAPAVAATVNYPELTSDIQTRLFKLGFYNDDINGLQTEATKEAIINFKTLFAMSETDARITGALLTELKRAARDQEAALKQAERDAELVAQAAVQVAEVAPPAIEFYDTVQAVPSTPVVTDTLPAAEETSAYIAPNIEPEPVKVASIPSVTETAPAPAVQDVIVEAKMLQNASAKYPATAQRRNYYVNVEITVDYDIDASGRATNISIASNDHSGRYNDAFEREAIKAIERLRYEPKTVNGVAVETLGNQKRIVFRAE